MPDPEPSQPATAPSRIKRNSACTSCRDAKVRCNPSSQPTEPCQRCAKLLTTCVVDKSHRRIPRKSKIDELAKEILSIKQSVGPASVPTSGAVFTQHQNALQSIPRERELSQPSIPTPSTGLAVPSEPRRYSAGPAVSENAPFTETSFALHTPDTLAQDQVIGPSLPRALKSHPFTGEEIDYYFQKYFEFYHPYMPIIRQRDPNKCYENGPLLFWTIIYIACRRFARDPSLLKFLMEEVKGEMYASMAQKPSISTINAMILASSWIFPDVRFINDPSALFMSVAKNSCTLLGIHTGKGAHEAYSHGIFQNSFTDEDASYTWAGYNIVAQRVSSYLGLPPAGVMFNQAVQNVIDGRTSFHVPPAFRVLLECQKFCNHVSKTMSTYMEDSRGVSAHAVQLLEDEWNAVQGIICSERADDLDRFNALLVQLEIQIYYMLPPPGTDREALRRRVLRTCTTAQAVLREALALEDTIGFLHRKYSLRSLHTASQIPRTGWARIVRACSETSSPTHASSLLPYRLAG
ncbi:hypothetical protein F4780DRAFT_723227 [Xylariomycetidae sp. FL0641]|nr:hypothetical protein F4780DRAFT_723227 [Xylariomycetidae sp. FL0641]